MTRVVVIAIVGTKNRVRIGREYGLEKYKNINTNVCPKVLPQTTFKEKNKIINIQNRRRINYVSVAIRICVVYWYKVIYD